jgi:hypothetical protein
MRDAVRGIARPATGIGVNPNACRRYSRSAVVRSAARAAASCSIAYPRGQARLGEVSYVFSAVRERGEAGQAVMLMGFPGRWSTLPMPMAV